SIGCGTAFVDLARECVQLLEKCILFPLSEVARFDNYADIIQVRMDSRLLVSCKERIAKGAFALIVLFKQLGCLVARLVPLEPNAKLINLGKQRKVQIVLPTLGILLVGKTDAIGSIVRGEGIFPIIGDENVT